MKILYFNCSMMTAWRAASFFPAIRFCTLTISSLLNLQKRMAIIVQSHPNMGIPNLTAIVTQKIASVQDSPGWGMVVL